MNHKSPKPLILSIFFLISLFSLSACDISNTGSKQAEITFQLAQFQKLTTTPAVHGRTLSGPIDGINSVEIRITRDAETEQEKTVASTLLNNAQRTISLSIPPSIEVKVYAAAFAGPNKTFEGSTFAGPFFPGQKASVNLLMNPVENDNQPIQVDLTLAKVAGNKPSFGTAFSFGNNYILFRSEADNLTENDTNGVGDIFLKNTVTGAITNLHSDNEGKVVEAETGPESADISADGRYVVFATSAAGLVSGDNNKLTDVFIKDTHTGINKLISRYTNGNPSDKPSTQPSISDDGRFIVFTSAAALAGEDKPGVFLYDRIAQQLTHLIEDATLAVLSGDGSHAAFKQLSTGNLVVMEISSGKLTAIVQAKNLAAKYSYMFDLTGKRLVFESSIATDKIKPYQIYLYDGEIRQMSVDADGVSLSANTNSSRSPSISADGRYVSFEFNGIVYAKAVSGGLAPVAQGKQPFISLDGREVGFSDRQGHLFVLANPLFEILADAQNSIAKPTNIRMTRGVLDIQLAWDPVEKARYYRVYSSDKKEFAVEDKNVAFLETTVNSAIIGASAFTGDKLYVKVTGVSSFGESTADVYEINLPFLIRRINPAAGATGVASRPTIDVEFTQALDQNSILSNSIYLSLNGIPVVTKSSFPDNKTVRLQPEGSLLEFTTYTLHIAGDIKNILGISLSSAHSQTFTTGGLPPGLTSVIPGSVNTADKIQLSFNKAIDINSLNNGGIVLTQGEQVIALSFTTSQNNVIITPKAQLDAMSDYTLTINSTLRDTEGKNFVGVVTGSFSTSYHQSKISSGSGHACAIRSDRTLWCWGRNFQGQLGDNSNTNVTSPVQEDSKSSWLGVSVSSNHTCAIRNDHTLWCWGDNSYGQIGLNPEGVFESLVPVQVGASENWEIVSTGSKHSCAINSDSELHCWGDNFNGQLGDTSNSPHYTPASVMEMDASESVIPMIGWIDVSAGLNHTCAIRLNRSLYCWGSNNNNQLGISNGGLYFEPQLVDQSSWSSVVVGSDTSCGTKTNHQLLCWGANSNGQSGTGDMITPVLTPTQEISLGSDWAYVSTSNNLQTCANKLDGSAWCWGRIYVEGAGNATQPILTPTQEPTLSSNWREIAVGYNFGCANNTLDDVYCWGENYSGQIGVGVSEAGAAAPIEIANSIAPLSMASTSKSYTYYSTHTCVVATGRLWCWGANGFGQVVSTADEVSIIDKPTERMPSKTDWVKVSNGSLHTCAIDSNGFVWCWGANYSGQLGIGTTGVEYSPVMIESDIVFNSVSAGNNHTCALSNNGLLYCWGGNTSGQLGFLTDQGADSLIPGEVSAGEGLAWTSVEAGLYHTCAIKSDDTLWCWGDNDSQQINDGYTGVDSTPLYQYETPVIIETVSGDNIASKWQSVSPGEHHTCAIDNLNRLWCWGRNYNGELGFDPLSETPQPYLFSSTETWASISAGADTSCGIQSNNTLWCWGSGDFGQIGNNTASYRQTEPAQEYLGRADWESVDVGGDSVCAMTQTGSLYCWGGNDDSQLGNTTIFPRPQKVKFDFPGLIFVEFVGD
ncbi:MAG: Ig-like domain-containing protein [Gammaproteobacteria bacterium]|nr:Ig-like domain-containing protein [Gammaproteobacteria bacterium]